MKIKPLLRFFALACAGYATLTGAMFLGQRRLMYHPDTETPNPAMYAAADMDVVTLTTADGLDLSAWYRAPADGRPVLVYFHGNAGHIGIRVEKARPYMDAGYGALLVSWRGYGGNPGSPTEEGLYHDGRAALDFLAARNVTPDRVVLYGESLGTGIAVQMAIESTPAALVLEAPYSTMADVAGAHYWYLPARHILLDRFASVDKIGDLKAPLLIIHGEADRVVPTDLGRKLFAAAPEPKEAKFFPGGGHSDLYDRGAAEVVLDFLERKVE